MKKHITLDDLKAEARVFCDEQSKLNHVELIGVTDGKAVGTYVEHRFQNYLNEKYEIGIGSSARGIDLPDDEIMTDIKVTSITQPQSSCPFKNARQKIFGLGYNLLVFVYEKHDTHDTCTLNFKYCTFILATPKMSIHLEVDVIGCKPGQLECGVVSLEVDVAARRKDKRKGGEN